MTKKTLLLLCLFGLSTQRAHSEAGLAVYMLYVGGGMACTAVGAAGAELWHRYRLPQLEEKEVMTPEDTQEDPELVRLREEKQRYQDEIDSLMGGLEQQEREQLQEQEAKNVLLDVAGNLRKERDQLIFQAEQAVERFKAEKAELQADWEQEMTELEASCNQNEREKTRLQAEWEQEKDRLQNVCNESEKEMTRLQAGWEQEMAQLEASCNQSEKENAKLQRDCDRCTKAKARLQGDCDHCEKEKAQWQKKAQVGRAVRGTGKFE